MDDGGCQYHLGSFSIIDPIEEMSITLDVWYGIESFTSEQQTWLINNDTELSLIGEQILHLGVQTNPNNNGWDMEKADSYSFILTAQLNNNTTFTKTITATEIDLKRID